MRSLRAAVSARRGRQGEATSERSLKVARAGFEVETRDRDMRPRSGEVAAHGHECVHEDRATRLQKSFIFVQLPHSLGTVPDCELSPIDIDVISFHFPICTKKAGK